jgi:hypothetical protein
VSGSAFVADEVLVVLATDEASVDPTVEVASVALAVEDVDVAYAREGIEPASMVEEVWDTLDVARVGLVGQPSSIASDEAPFLSDEGCDKQPGDLVSEQLILP